MNLITLMLHFLSLFFSVEVTYENKRLHEEVKKLEEKVEKLEEKVELESERLSFTFTFILFYVI